MEYEYPRYEIALADGLMNKCADLAPRLLNEGGLAVPNDRFLSRLKGKSGIRIEGHRVHYEKDLVGRFIEQFISEQKETLAEPDGRPVPKPDWTVRTAGYSMMTIDLETEQTREGTCDDLRDMIKLANAFGIGGNYMIMPQDLPPLVRAIACYKICWETSDTVEPGDYQHFRQVPFVHEMYQVMGKKTPIRICVHSPMTLDAMDLDIFLYMYPFWKRDRSVTFGVQDYAMLGITKPVTVTGCAAMMFCETLAAHILFRLFDPDLHVKIGMGGGQPTDMRSVCWAFGSPRGHLFRYLNTQIRPNLCGYRPKKYTAPAVRLETSSAAVDELAGMEKMATALLGAMQGARVFNYAGALCVDDLYSGTQFVIDLEIVKYVQELVESFAPHPDIIESDGLYEELMDVTMGRDLFLSHPNTVRRFRNIVPSSDLIIREKLRSWLSHHKTLKDRAREMAVERLRGFEPSFRLPEEKQKALDNIYARAEKELA